VQIIVSNKGMEEKNIFLEVSVVHVFCVSSPVILSP
jgi:hypothetical protein